MHSTPTTDPSASPAAVGTTEYEEVLPSHPPWRSLVICYDGHQGSLTKLSNLTRFTQMLHKGDSTRQLVYYDVRLVVFLGVSPVVVQNFLGRGFRLGIHAGSSIQKISPYAVLSFAVSGADTVFLCRIVRYPQADTIRRNHR